jgi:hypothetical protein
MFGNEDDQAIRQIFDVSRCGISVLYVLGWSRKAEFDSLSGSNKNFKVILTKRLGN